MSETCDCSVSGYVIALHPSICPVIYGKHAYSDLAELKPSRQVKLVLFIPIHKLDKQFSSLFQLLRSLLQMSCTTLFTLCCHIYYLNLCKWVFGCATITHVELTQYYDARVATLQS